MVRVSSKARSTRLTTKLPLRYRLPAGVCRLYRLGRDQRAFRLVGVDIDETDMHAGKGLPALHLDGVANQALAVGQMAAVPAGKGAENLDIPDRVIITVAEREGDLGIRAEPAPAPELR